MHQVSGRDYPRAWMRRIELFLDEGHHRLVFFGGLFGGFVLLFVVALLIGVIIDGSPMAVSAAALG
ncbi:hypothetical protein AUC69_08750 [Methyloceanibacter superfactus]|uniref:Uncharacterized protein n=1 Tax=Methyloceanibacter superfactus TaxID=1774969 RepID=A0A1E3W1K8_9HYPH|nr:hypothetical protein AUC69_08750 [Methyloceanibacter superfactus]